MTLPANDAVETMDNQPESTITTNTDTKPTGIVSKITSILFSKKGMIILGVLLLAGGFFYYKKFYSKKPKKEIENNQNINQPPPGYITVPQELLEGMNQNQVYPSYDQPMQDYQPPNQQGKVNKMPVINEDLDDDNEQVNNNQQLTKEEMVSIQQQLQTLNQQQSNM